MESDNLSCEQVSSALTSAGIGNHAVRPQNGRLFPLTANSDHGMQWADLVMGRVCNGSTLLWAEMPVKVNKNCTCEITCAKVFAEKMRIAFCDANQGPVC